MKKPDISSDLLRSQTHRTITAKREKKNYRKSNINHELIQKQTDAFLASGGKIEKLPIGESGVEI